MLSPRHRLPPPVDQAAILKHQHADLLQEELAIEKRIRQCQYEIQELKSGIRLEQDFTKLRHEFTKEVNLLRPLRPMEQRRTLYHRFFKSFLGEWRRLLKLEKRIEFPVGLMTTYRTEVEQLRFHVQPDGLLSDFIEENQASEEWLIHARILLEEAESQLVRAKEDYAFIQQEISDNRAKAKELTPEPSKNPKHILPIRPNKLPAKTNRRRAMNTATPSSWKFVLIFSDHDAGQPMPKKFGQFVKALETSLAKARLYDINCKALAEQLLKVAKLKPEERYLAMDKIKKDGMFPGWYKLHFGRFRVLLEFDDLHRSIRMLPANHDIYAKIFQNS